MKRMIMGTDYYFKEDEIPIERLRFWPENPRIYADMYSLYDENTPDFTKPELQEKIYNELKGHNDVRELSGQIEMAGLMEALIVRKNNRNTYDVLEGNRRLAACRIIKDKAKTKKQTKIIKRFSNLSCEIAPGDLPKNHVFALLGTLHITGKLQWEPFAKASYVKRRVDALKKEGLPEHTALENVGAELGERKHTVATLVANIELMKYANEQITTRYSFYDVLNRNRVVCKDLEDDALKKQWVTSISDWNEKATEFRDAVKAIVKDSRALKKFRNGDLNLEKSAQLAEDSGSTNIIYQKVKRFRDSMVNAKPRLKKLGVEEKLISNKLRFEFGKLETLINDINRILDEKNG